MNCLSGRLLAGLRYHGGFCAARRGAAGFLRGRSLSRGVRIVRIQHAELLAQHAVAMFKDVLDDRPLQQGQGTEPRSAGTARSLWRLK